MSRNLSLSLAGSHRVRVRLVGRIQSLFVFHLFRHGEDVDCLWTWAAGRSWLWWALLGQVAVVAGLVLMGIGWCGRRDRVGACLPQAEKRRG